MREGLAEIRADGRLQIETRVERLEMFCGCEFVSRVNRIGRRRSDRVSAFKEVDDALSQLASLIFKERFGGAAINRREVGSIRIKAFAGQNMVEANEGAEIIERAAAEE